LVEFFFQLGFQERELGHGPPPSGDNLALAHKLADRSQLFAECGGVEAGLERVAVARLAARESPPFAIRSLPPCNQRFAAFAQCAGRTLSCVHAPNYAPASRGVNNFVPQADFQLDS